MRDWINLIEDNRARLGDYVTARTNDPEADFWLVRRSSEDLVGEPKRTFDKEMIGIKITRPDVLNRDYLYYMMTHLWQQGIWKTVATGTTRLVSIKTGDVLGIAIG